MALLGVAVALALAAGPIAPARAQAPLPPKASILVDAGTGAVLEATNARQPLPPASLTKIITALAAVANLEPGTAIPISARAAGMPAHNLNMKEGQAWVIEDVLASLLLSSANDAGMALAERVSGTAEAFSGALADTATRLGMADRPTLSDPSGLDDEFSVSGGNLLSARDLAIAARALLSEPRLSTLVSSSIVNFTGGDNIAHRLVNHNRLLSRYEGAVGMKTGYTRRAMHGLVAAATRNGRTMIAVIVGAPGDTYGLATGLLDKGFATAAGARPTGDTLPAVVTGAALKRQPVRQTSPVPARQVGSELAAGPTAASRSDGGVSLRGVAGFLLKMLVGLATVVAILRIRVKANAAQQLRTRPKGYRASSAQHAGDALMMAPAVIEAPPDAPAVAPPPRRPDRPLKARPAQHAARRRARTTEPGVEPEVDPKLARRFEILVRTGQVVP